MTWTQVYVLWGNWWLTTLLAALPIIVLFTLLAGLRVKPHWCAIAGAATAVVVAVLFFKMPAALAGMTFLYGVAFGILKIAWIVLAAVYLYDISVFTGQFEIMKESVAGITADRRLQLLLVAFCFGAFIEGAAGFGAPVAIAGAFMIGLGFKPFHAAALNLIANTAPVAWGAIGTPVHTLAAVTALPESDLNAMIGRILPFTAVIVPFWLVRAMVSWKETWEVAPAILVVGFSFGLTQYFWSNHVDSNLVDIMGGVVSIIATVAFLRFWRPKKIWRFGHEQGHYTVFQSCAGKRQGAARPAGLGRTLFAQCRDPVCAGSHETYARSGEVRLQLAVGDRNGLLFRSHCLRTVAGYESDTADEEILAHLGAHAAGDDRYFIHAGAWIRHAVLRTRRRAGARLHANRLALSVFWHLPRLARRRAHGQRYLIKRPLRKLAAHHLAAARRGSSSDVRGQQRRRRDGQNGGRPVHYHRHVGDESGGQRGHYFPLRLLALRGPWRHRGDYRYAVRVRLLMGRAAWADVRKIRLLLPGA